jgi:hypothetical protein
MIAQKNSVMKQAPKKVHEHEHEKKNNRTGKGNLCQRIYSS